MCISPLPIPVIRHNDQRTYRKSFFGVHNFRVGVYEVGDGSWEVASGWDRSWKLTFQTAQCSSPIVCGIIFTLLYHRSFHMFAISKHLFTSVCYFRKTFFHMSNLARHPFTYVLQQNIHWHTDYANKLKVFTSVVFFPCVSELSTTIINTW